jgi:hypothetical protein
MAGSIDKVDPHTYTMEILQERYKEKHPYKSMLFDLDYDDVKSDPELSAEYNKIFNDIAGAQDMGDDVDISVAPCPYRKRENPSNPDCTISSMTVTKDGRKYDLNVFESESLSSKEELKNVIEVVGGDRFKPASLTFSLKGLINNCPTHNQTQDWNIPHGKVESVVPNKAVVSLTSNGDMHLLPWTASSKDYRITANTCSKKLIAVVRVYPDIAVDLSVSFKKAYEKKTVNEDTSKATEITSPTGKKEGVRAELSTTKYEVVEFSSGLTIGATYSQDGINYSFKKTFAQTVKKIQKLEELVYGVLEWIDGFSGKAGKKDRKEVMNIVDDYRNSINSETGVGPNDSLSFTFPSISLTLASKWEEMAGDYRCDCPGSIELATSPLIAVTFKKDLGPYIFNAIPGGSAVSAVKQLLKEINIEVLAIFFSFTCDISGSAKYTAYLYQEPKIEGGITVKVPVEVNAILVKATKETPIPFTKSYCLKTVIDLSLNAKTGIQHDARFTKQGKQANLEFSGQFLGVEVFLQAVIDVSTGQCTVKKPAGHTPLVPGEGKPEDASATTPGMTHDPYKYMIYKKDASFLYKFPIPFT